MIDHKTPAERAERNRLIVKTLCMAREDIGMECLSAECPAHGNRPHARIAVVGTRRMCPIIRSDVRRVLAARLRRGRFTIVTGGADGVDLEAERFGFDNGLHVIVIRPHYGSAFPAKVAPLIRNGVIANECDGMIAWPSRTPGGTDNAIGWASKLNRPCVVRKPWEAVR